MYSTFHWELTNIFFSHVVIFIHQYKNTSKINFSDSELPDVKMFLPTAGGKNKMVFKSPFQPNAHYDTIQCLEESTLTYNRLKDDGRRGLTMVGTAGQVGATGCPADSGKHWKHNRPLPFYLTSDQLGPVKCIWAPSAKPLGCPRLCNTILASGRWCRLRKWDI